MKFAKWEVNGVEYKLRLKSSTVCELEEKLNGSLFGIMNGEIPTLKTMLTVVFYSMKDFNSGIKREEVNYIYDSYVEEGGSQLELFSEIIMDIFKVSGFLSQAQVEEMEAKQQKEEL